VGVLHPHIFGPLTTGISSAVPTTKCIPRCSHAGQRS
jgi:hypothetical protein